MEEIRYILRFVSMARYAKCRAEGWNSTANLMELVELSTKVNYNIINIIINNKLFGNRNFVKSLSLPIKVSEYCRS